MTEKERAADEVAITDNEKQTPEIKLIGWSIVIAIALLGILFWIGTTFPTEY